MEDSRRDVRALFSTLRARNIEFASQEDIGSRQVGIFQFLQELAFYGNGSSLSDDIQLSTAFAEAPGNGF